MEEGRFSHISMGKWLKPARPRHSHTASLLHMDILVLYSVYILVVLSVNEYSMERFLDARNKSISAFYLSIYICNVYISRPEMDWHTILPQAVYFSGTDDEFFGRVFIMIYKHACGNVFGSVCFSQRGVSHQTRLITDSGSRFHAAIENLKPSHRKSNIRRCLAVTLLEAFARCQHKSSWDETNAGDLASKMKLIKNKTPEEVGNLFRDLGLLDDSLQLPNIVDVIHKSDLDIPLLVGLGQKVDHLFDPLVEYSPEPTEIVYKPPETGIAIDDTAEVSAICDELVSLQTNFTLGLVNFLQSFVIPLRVKALNKEIQCSTSDFNAVFPPTIDEVTRINCIFLDSLRTSRDFGSLEVVKSCGAMIPYFYKACMRHEAATKGFSEKLSMLMDTIRDVPGGHSIRSIDVIMNGSSLHLSRLNLVLSRLVKTKEWTNDEKPIVDACYTSALRTIDSFGKDKLRAYHNRIFTPTGKILTELADNWPASLHFDWRNRRVVTVFSAIDLTSGCELVVIIFSDVVVITQVVRSSEQHRPQMHTPSLPDVLMHSLINEVSLPQNLPEMETVCCMNVEKAVMKKQGSKLLIQCGEDAFLLETKKVDEKIVQLNKAKILNKKCPIQLFKSGATYWVAFNAESSSEKAATSSYCVFLDQKIDQHTLDVCGYTVGASVSVIEDSAVYRLHFKNVLGASYEEVVSHDDLSDELCIRLAKMNSSGIANRSIDPYSIAENRCILEALNAMVVKPRVRNTLMEDKSRVQTPLSPNPVERKRSSWKSSSFFKKFSLKKKPKKDKAPTEVKIENNGLKRPQKILQPEEPAIQAVYEDTEKDLESCSSTITPSSSCHFNKRFHFPQDVMTLEAEGKEDEFTLEYNFGYDENEKNWYYINNEPGCENVDDQTKTHCTFQNKSKANFIASDVGKRPVDKPNNGSQTPVSVYVRCESPRLTSNPDLKTTVPDLSYYSPSHLAQPLDAAPTLVNDESYNYLGNFLNGDIILRENSNIDRSVMQIDSGNEKLFDLYYQRKLRESSARYISSLIRSGNSITRRMDEHL